MTDSCVSVSQPVGPAQGTVWCGQLGAAVVLSDTTRLRLFIFTSGQPKLARRVALGAFGQVLECKSSSFSPDGAHWATVMTKGSWTKVLVVDSMTGAVFQHSIDLSSPTLRWSTDGSRLLATELTPSLTRHYVRLLDFTRYYDSNTGRIVAA